MIYALMLLAVIMPPKTWFAPDARWTVNVKGDQVQLLLTDYAGRPINAQGSADVSGDKSIDLKEMFPAIVNPGTYLLFEIPKGDTAEKFAGVPVVVEVRQDRRRGAPEGPMVVKMSPLQYAVIDTEFGPITLIFYYDAAPDTVANFIQLAFTGFYDGLTFHKITPDFVIRGGDPRGNGSGGPGYHIDAEFSDRNHTEGVVSMSRVEDPNEASGGTPRCEFANSAGSQFFICLNYQKTKQLDGRYTAFAQVIEGMDAVHAIAKMPVAEDGSGKPLKPVIMRKVEIRSVTSANNPYHGVIRATLPTTFPSTLPVTLPATVPVK